MLGILVTNTSAFPGISKDEYQDRMREFAKCISSIVDRISIPKELIIIDNSIPETIKTEKLLVNMPCPVVIVRSNLNPGKETGEMIGIRDGIALSYSRGHDWLLKIPGRYFINKEWDIAADIKTLEKSEKKLLLPLTLDTHDNLKNQGLKKLADLLQPHKKPIIGASPAAFIIQPLFALQNGFLGNKYLYTNIEGIPLLYKFFNAIKNIPWLRWDNPPFDGYIGRLKKGKSFRAFLKEKQSDLLPEENSKLDDRFADINTLLESAVSHYHR